MLVKPIELLPADQVGAIHFIAAGGSGMSGVARLYAISGIPTSGSDQVDSKSLRALEAAGATVYVGHDPSQIGDEVETVVVSSAVNEANVELIEARKRGLRIWHRSAALAAMALGKTCISISGSHGKTTTTGMAAVAVACWGLAPSYVIGGTLTTTGLGADLCPGEPFLIEADESDGSFLQYPTKIAVITNIEADHLINWGTEEAYAAAYYDFATVDSVELVIINIDDPGSRALADRLRAEGRTTLTYGADPAADIRFKEVTVTASGSRATISCGEDEGEVEIGVPGAHNISNSCAVYALGKYFGIPHEAILTGLNAFSGTGRRFQLVADCAGIRVYDDYAHHPTEIKAVLTAARELITEQNRATGQRGRLIACFQPHHFSRTLDFAEEFGLALTLADVVVVNGIWNDREPERPGVTGEILADAAKKYGAKDVHYVEDRHDLPEALNAIACPGDYVFTLGAGDIAFVGSALAHLLEQRAKS